MRKHICQCLNCNLQMIPDFDISDPTIHSREKCNTTFMVLVDGKEVGYTSGVTKEGREGWYMFAGVDTDDIHTHQCKSGNGIYTCLETRFGNVTVIHD